MTPTTPAILALDLDYDLISHLADRHSVARLQAEKFSGELLEDPLARVVFDWQMTHLREHGVPALGSVLEDEFAQVTIEPPQAAIGDLIERIRARYMRNQGRDMAKRIAIAINEEPLKVPALMMRGGRELADLVVERGEIYGSGDHQRLMAEYDRRALLGRGPSLGYKELNDHFNGIAGVTFMIGPPKSGKSWVTINTIRDNILDERRVKVYSLELPAVEYTMRLKHMMADIPYHKFLKGSYLDEDRKWLETASDVLDDAGWFEIEKPQPGDRGVQRMIEGALNAEADVVVIDQLQYVENRKGVNLGTTNNTGDYWEVCNDLRDYSDEIPIFVVHQFNRSVMNAKELPEAQQAKGSAAVEEVSTLVLGIWADPEMRRDRELELGTLASRNYDYQSWTLGIDLTDHCAIRMKGRREKIWEE